MFDANNALRHARLAHQNLASWIGILLSLLANQGIDREEARMKMTGLLKRMNSVSEVYAPPIVTLALTCAISVQMDRAETHFGKDSPLITGVRQSADGIAQDLICVLKDLGWNKNQMTEKMTSLVHELLALPSNADSLIFPLAVAVSLDKYASDLVSEIPVPQDYCSLIQ